MFLLVQYGRLYARPDWTLRVPRADEKEYEFKLNLFDEIVPEVRDSPHSLDAHGKRS